MCFMSFAFARIIVPPSHHRRKYKCKCSRLARETLGKMTKAGELRGMLAAVTAAITDKQATAALSLFVATRHASCLCFVALACAHYSHQHIFQHIPCVHYSSITYTRDKLQAKCSSPPAMPPPVNTPAMPSPTVPPAPSILPCAYAIS